MADFTGLELDVVKPQRMIIRHPAELRPLTDADGNPGYFDLYSADSDQAKRHHRKVAKARLEARRGKLSAEDFEREAVELLAALTAGWRLISLTGEPLDVPFSHENARDLYSKPSLAWLRDQVDEFVTDRGNFSKTSPQD